MAKIRLKICPTPDLSRIKEAYRSDVLGLRNIQGCWALVPVSGTVDSQKYIEISENYLRPSISWYFGDDAVTLQQDNAPCHVSRVVQEYLNENDIFTIEWPAQSPDLNILENIWLSIKRKLHSEASEVKSEEDLIERFVTRGMKLHN